MGTGEQKLTSYKSIHFSLLHSVVPYYLQHRCIEPTWAFKAGHNMQPPAALSTVLFPQIPHTYLMLQPNLSVRASSSMPQPLPPPRPRSGFCRKCPPPASPSVKTPPLMVHFRRCVPWSLFPGNLTAQAHPHLCVPWHLVCAVPALGSCLMLPASVNLSVRLLVCKQFEDGACVIHVL